MFHDTQRPPTDEESLITPSDLFGHQPLSLSVQVTTEDDTQSRDQKINEVVDQLIPAAFEHRHGILVTQQDVDLYTVQIDPSVPCGTIHEKRH
ncbi:hypothetical protein [Pseudarthrobacter sp. YAF2]|uniref:hypothetical protein n=1 Tax=Pseudarthrobacter sp. YAF2 TaxID=3233078 RepID=UPI003F9460C0